MELNKLWAEKMSWLIPEVEEHDIWDHGFKIRIVDKSSGFREFSKEVKKVILAVCRRENHFIKDKLGDLNFILVGSTGIRRVLSRKARGWVRAGKKNIYLNLNQLITDNKKEQDKEIYKTVVHEIFHLNDDYQSKVLLKKQALGKRVRKPSIISKNRKARNVREAIQFFFHGLRIEGLAEAIAYYSTNISSREGRIEALHLKAKSEASKINDLLLSYFSNETPRAMKKKLIKVLKEELRDYKYSIGEYMCVRITSTEKNENTSTLIKTKPLKFIRKYEAAEIKSGNKPVVSLNSKRGILDYNNILVKLSLLNK